MLIAEVTCLQSMNAIMYCRVSSRDQVDGTSLDSQESACRDYAQKHNLAVSKVFVEEGESAKYADRTQLLALLSYCKEKSRKIEVLIVWKVDRFARNVEDHYMIKAALRKVGVRVVSVTEPISADATGKLMETVLAGFAQFDNDVRAVRSVQGMQRRLQEGIFPWKPPLGYIPPRIGKKTKPDGPDPRRFEPLQKAWKLFASGTQSKASILRLLHDWGITGYRGELISAQRLDHMFRNQYYAGILRDPWGGDEYKGCHTPMVTQREFAKIQHILDRNSNSRPHRQLREEFALKGLVRCPSCEAYLTASFATGRSQRYPYYKCFRTECQTRTRSYQASLVQTEFAQFLTTASVPAFVVTGLMKEVLLEYSENVDQLAPAATRIQNEVARAERQLQELISMRADKLVSDEEFIAERTRLQQRRFELQASEPDTPKPLSEEEARQLVGALADLKTTWQYAPPVAKRTIGQILLPAGYVYQRVGTAPKGLIIKAFSDFGTRNPRWVSAGREQGLGTASRPHQFRGFGSSHASIKDLVPLVKTNWNQLLLEMRRFLGALKPLPDAPKRPSR